MYAKYVKEVTVFLRAGRREAPFTSQPVLAELHWKFWLGHAPMVDYMPERCHISFRYWYDYSGGTMNDWGGHHIDIVYWRIGLAGPTQIEGKALSTPIPGGYTTIADYVVKFTGENAALGNSYVAREMRKPYDYGFVS